MGSCVCVQSSSEWPRNTESASCGSEPAFLANAASSVMSVALASPTKVAWTGLGTSGQWTLPKPCSGKKTQLTRPGPVPERVQLILDLGSLGFWQEVQNLQKVRLLFGRSQIKTLGL